MQLSVVYFVIDNIMIFLIVLFLIIAEAISEALYDKGTKTLSGVFEFILRAATTLVVLFWLFGIDSPFGYELSLFKLIGGYVLLRFALFDVTYNLVRGLPVFYVGETKLYDKLWRKFFYWSGIDCQHFLAMFKFIALLISVTWLLDINGLIEKL